VSGRKSTAAVVSREYRPASDVCARALEHLLKKPVRKEAAPASRPDDAEGSKNDRTATDIIPGK
jgi:Arc/MetJ-type ribon-helix-helix transcriptional regulator